MSLFTTTFGHGQHHDRAMTSPGPLLQARYLLEHGPWRRKKHPKALLPAAKVMRQLSTVASDQIGVTWVGHASFVIQIAGKSVLTDPVWSKGIVGGLRRFAPPGIEWLALPVIDAVVISHNHFDHLDWPTLRRLPRTTPLFVPHGLAAWFHRREFTCVNELDWWQASQLGELTFTCVPAHHWSRRTMWDTNHALWGGWVIGNGSGQSVYFAGDTAYGNAFRQIGEQFPGIDIALIPIGAYAPKWYNGWAHLDPAEAVQAFEDLGAQVLFPMHYGAFRMSPDTPSEALGWVREAWGTTSRPLAQLWDEPPGVRRIFNEPRPQRILSTRKRPKRLRVPAHTNQAGPQTA